MTLAAGELDQRIALLRPVPVESPLGGQRQEDRILRKVWARVMEGTSKEFVNQGAQREQKRAAFKIRWAADLNTLGTTLKVGWNGLLYEVTGMTGTRRLGELWLQCMSIGDYDAG